MVSPFYLRCIVIAVISSSAVLITPVQSQEISPDFPTTTAQRLNDGEQPNVDGILDEPLWQRLDVVDEFHQIKPTDHGPPSERTEVMLAYDSNYIYIGLRAHDSDAANIVAKGLIQGQNYFSDDRFEVRFDTFNDRRNAYFFQVNANGIRRDALLGNDYFINDWDTVWYANSVIHDWGWSAEMQIPLKSIAFDPNSATWGLNFSRTYPRRGEEMSWSSRERNLSPAVSGYAEGLRDLDQGLGLEIVPSVSMNYRDIDGEGSDFEIEPSLTTFYNITPYLTGGLTLNTDFSATEVDERQINLTRFSLFFPEKRDFFLRDASIFEFGNLDRNGRPFFSRRIGLAANGNPLDINAGIKLSGRAGEWNLGALAIQQDAGVAGADETLFVGRVTRNVLDESEVGFIATQGDPNSVLDNRLYGVDFSYRNSEFLGNRRLRANVWLQQSDTEGIDDDQNAYGVRLSYPNDRIDAFVDWRRIEENFNPALGFVNRRGVDQLDGQIRYRHRLSDSFWQWLGARVQFFRSDRIDGGIQSESNFLNVFEGFSRGNDFFTFFIGEETEGLIEDFEINDGIVIPAGVYKSDRRGFFFETGTQRPWAFEFEVVDGDFFGGTNLFISPEVEWRPSKHLNTSLEWRRNRIKLPEGNFDSELYSARVNVAFNSRWAWLNLVQGDNLSDTVSINSRLRYEPRADREYFLVFNQTRDRDSNDVLDTAISFKASFNLRF